MTIASESSYHATGRTDGPLFSSLDIAGGIVAAVMILLPLTAGATHYSRLGWNDTVQTAR